MLTPHLLSEALLLLLSLMCGSVWSKAVEEQLEVYSASGLNATLSCNAKQLPGVQYLSVRWYKTESSSSHQRMGLLARSLPNGTTRWYKDVSREVELQGQSHDLLLPNVTCGDGGVYLCYLAAPVGQQNQEGKVLLTLTDCPSSSTEPPVGPETPLTESPVGRESPLLTDTVMVIFASALLVLALLISFLSYKCLKNTVKDRMQVAKKEISLNAPLRPLEKKDLMLIYTLGPKTSTMKHICV